MPNLPAAPKKKSDAFLDKVRAAKTPARKSEPSRELIDAALAPRRPRLVFAFDATASRAPAWEAAQAATDSLFTALPGSIDVALAVHGGDQVHTFTGFDDVDAFRKKAASIQCKAGRTRLVKIMERTLAQSGVKAFLYVGDCFEEVEDDAYAEGDRFKARGIRAIMIHDESTTDSRAWEVFCEIARRTGGVCIKLHSGDRQAMRDIFAAVAVLAAGGVKLLKAEQGRLPGAAKLLPFLKE